jgi:hypothetical protein
MTRHLGFSQKPNQFGLEFATLQTFGRESKRAFLERGTVHGFENTGASVFGIVG